MIRFYQLVARGQRSRLSGSNKICSRRIFRTKSEAEAYKEEFREIVITPKDDFDLAVLSDDLSLRVEIVVLVAEDE